jgi:mannose/fructose/N-acetylgalactosamine-specific phosphotransferase system component IIC
MSVADPAPQPSASTQAIAALVIGLVSVMTCCGMPLAPVAWYLGNQELKAIAEGRSPASGNGVAMAGKILGMIGTLMMALAVVWIFFMGGFVILQAWLSSHT